MSKVGPPTFKGWAEIEEPAKPRRPVSGVSKQGELISWKAGGQAYPAASNATEKQSEISSEK